MRRCRTSPPARPRASPITSCVNRGCASSAAPRRSGAGAAWPWIRSTTARGPGFHGAAGRSPRPISRPGWRGRGRGSACASGTSTRGWARRWRCRASRSTGRGSIPSSGSSITPSGASACPTAAIWPKPPMCASRHVEELVLAGLDGRRLRLGARHTVLAAGGIENARLLLAARGAMPMGLGNAHDQVGRHFMEHPRAMIGLVHGREGLRLWAAYRAFHARGSKLTPGLRLPDAVQEARGVLNAAATLKYRPPAGRSLLGRIYDSARYHGAPNRQIAAGSGAFQVMVRAEQAPDPESRVTLARAADALGLPQARLDWRLGAQETETARAMADAFARALAGAGIGGFERAAWLDAPGAGWPTDPTISGHALGGYHHMGTTRMGTDPRTSVTDADCRLHGVDNLWIAGSSVFPTAGWSNPTLTILALALRLADTLAACATPSRG
ncbi:MAG: hypothetical protein CVT80_14640 [Alphaproteobacteria bacterium HGW-Alphaproteobacteria-2]|nr:MAG: hypothetical protein CVT80_14640 [Alphaproteobacteria bacterium HGW-Alphaproteobacteria-2]